MSTLDKIPDDVMTKALDAALAVVQSWLAREYDLVDGKWEGDIAAAHFSGNGHEGFDAIMQRYVDVEVGTEGDPAADARPQYDEDGERICSNPGGHKFECTGTQYGGDDERWHGEGRCLCIYCGHDGDA